MTNLTDKQKELLLSNKEDLKAIAKEFSRHWNIDRSLSDSKAFDNFAQQFEEKDEWKILSHKSLYDGIHVGNENCIKYKCDIHSVQYKDEPVLTVKNYAR